MHPLNPNALIWDDFQYYNIQFCNSKLPTWEHRYAPMNNASWAMNLMWSYLASPFKQIYLRKLVSFSSVGFYALPLLSYNNTPSINVVFYLIIYFQLLPQDQQYLKLFWIWIYRCNFYTLNMHIDWVIVGLTFPKTNYTLHLCGQVPIY